MRCTARDARFHGLLAPSISHEGYSKPSYSYWDDFFALSASRNCEYLAREIGDKDVEADMKAMGREFAADLARSLHDRRGAGEGRDSRLGRSRGR
jgi:hypothetical protein